MDIFTRLMVEEEGQGLIEYALIIAIISLVIVAAGPAVKTSIEGIFTKIRVGLDSAPTGP